MLIAQLPMIAVLIGVLVGSFTDIHRYKVYNKLTFPIFFGGLLFGVLTKGWAGLGFALGGAGLGMGVLLLPYLMGGLGAGDVKFVMAIGTWIGAALILPAILIGGLAVVVYHGLILARRNGVGGVWQSIHLLLFRLRFYGLQFASADPVDSVQAAAGNSDSPNHGRLIPFSAMMSVGILLTLMISWWLGHLPK